MATLPLHTAPAGPFADADLRSPDFGMLWREVRALADRRRFLGARAEDVRAVTEGAPVMLIPGFLAVDRAMARLADAIERAGYRAHGWGQGINLGASEVRLARLVAEVERIAHDAAQPVALVGWSLGGLFAREAAKRAPHAVSRVLTLGSPFSGDRRANNVWRLYEWVNGHSVDALPIACDLSAKPPVPTIALWSRGDGVIAPACARGLPHEADRAVEVRCGHIGFTYEEEAIAAVLDALKG